MSRKILVADLLCGAGGSSTGCERALRDLGLEMELVCVDHWQTAIETHRRNHPEARHYVQDIAAVRPHLLVPEGYLDLLMASPTCTHHSVARGGKPTSDQQRSDPWHIITWLTELRVKRIIIENVWEFCGWGPVDPETGKPIKERKGEYFFAWIETLRRLGFDPEWRKLNAADYGDATTRQRFILMARSDGRQVHWPRPTHTRRPAADMALFPGLRPWRSAREIIDWDIKGRSIFNRKKPLAAKTLERIYAGAVKLGWPAPYLVILRKHMDGQSLDGPLPALCTAGHLGVAEPVILSQHTSGAPRSAAAPLPTLTTGGAGAEVHPGCARPMLIEPFIATVAHGAEPDDPSADSRRCKSTDEPLGTMHAGGGKFALIEPLISLDEPTPTICATGHTNLVEPGEGFDILFRMLEPHELAAAMGFIGEDGAYQFVGTKTDQIKQIGNAVSVKKMKACVGALMADEADEAEPRSEAVA